MKSSGTKPNGSSRDLMNDGLTVQQEQRTGFNTFLLCSYHHLQDSHWLHNHCHIGFIFTEINLWEECTLHDPVSHFETQSVCLFTFAVWPVVLLLSPSKYTSRSESLWKLRLDEPFSKIPHDIFKSEKVAFTCGIWCAWCRKWVAILSIFTLERFYVNVLQWIRNKYILNKNNSVFW